MDLHFDEHNEASLKRFERMLKTDSVYFFDSADFEKIIIYYIDNGKISLAKKALELAATQHPDMLGIKVLQAELFIVENKFPEAERLLEELIVLDPHNEEVYIQSALLHSKQEKHQAAIDLLLKALELTDHEENIDILSLLGMEYLYMEKFDIAKEYFEKCLQLDPRDQTTLYNVVYCYDMQDKNEEAVSFLSQYIESEPYNENAWHQLGREYYILSRFDKALEAFDYALLIDEKFIGAYLEKAKTLEKLNRFSEAISYFLLTTKMDDPTAYAYLRVGKCYEKLDNEEKAIEYYEKSLEQDPYLEEPVFSLIEIYHQKDNYQKSLFYVNQLINLDDENPKYWKLYAKVNIKIAFFAEAAKAYEKCVALKDNTLDVCLNLADAYYYLGDYKKAIQRLLDAEMLYPRNSAINMRLSGLYFLNQNLDLGLKHFTLFIQQGPTKYREFQKLFPILHNSKKIQKLLYKNKLTK
jgi:tetratricopeptide (TPR) repeat protein